MNDTLNIILYILVMAGITYLIRALPLITFRKKINSHYIRSFLYYLPYTILTAMVIPPVFESTGNLTTALVGLIVAVLLAFLNQSLIKVALGASAAAFFTGIIINLA